MSNHLNIGNSIYGDLANDYIGIGNDSPDVALDVTGDIEYTGTITDVSDRRLKTDIQLLDPANVLERLTQIDTYTFSMIGDENRRIEYGVMAQEVEPLFPELVKTAKEVGIRWFSTPFDETAVDYLEEFDPSVYKIASFEIVDLPLIRYVAHTGKPMIISTGMASLEEIDAAVGAAEQGGATDITLLRTNSGYPAKTSEMDLAAIPFMRERWGYPVGLSDHTLGNTAAIVAATLGARVFEKHLTMARSDGGPDALFSSEPDELATYVESINDAISSWGSVRFGPSEHEKSSLAFRPSLRAVRDIVAGEKITSENVQSVRPSGGLPPDAFSTIENWKTLRNISSGDPIALEDLSSG
jgi:N-acetylneuraminate synthase